MRALIVLDAQNGFLEQKDFRSQLNIIHQLIDEFRSKNELVISTKHLDDIPESIIYKKSQGAEIEKRVAEKSSRILEKRNPNAFLGTGLEDELKSGNISELIITGFNSEYCCLFTSIAAVDRGYKVTLIEDACGTVNNGETYNYADLDITDFVATVLHWSETVQVLDFDEYKERERNDE